MEEAETLEESLVEKPKNLRKLAKCVGKQVRLDDTYSQQIVAYAGAIADYHMFVSQMPDNSENITEWGDLGARLFFEKGKIVLDRENYSYDIVKKGHERHDSHKRIIQEAGLWNG